MTPILGAIGFVVFGAAMAGFGWNLRALTAEPPLQTRFPPAPTCAVYLAIAIAGGVTAGVCLGVA